jgi:ATP adenylyltransferase
MNFNELKAFVSDEMRLSHIYQPFIIRFLVEANGTATLRSLAQALLLQDESQILYYENILKKMPLKILKKHGVVNREGELITLDARKMTLQEKAVIRRTCEERMQKLIEKRGLKIWDHRLAQTDAVPESIRYQILKEANGKCILCGTSAAESVLHVDHIVPRSKGGGNDVDNLQCLYESCNLGKGNKDDTDFRRSEKS